MELYSTDYIPFYVITQGYDVGCYLFYKKQKLVRSALKLTTGVSISQICTYICIQFLYSDIYYAFSTNESDEPSQFKTANCSRADRRPLQTSTENYFSAQALKCYFRVAFLDTLVPLTIIFMSMCFIDANALLWLTLCEG